MCVAVHQTRQHGHPRQVDDAWPTRPVTIERANGSDPAISNFDYLVFENAFVLDVDEVPGDDHRLILRQRNRRHSDKTQCGN